MGRTILGPRSHHRFVPGSSQSLEMRRLSDDSLFTFIDVAVDQLQRKSYPNVGKYVAYRYDPDWYVGLVCEKSYIEQDLKIQFMILNKTTKSLG